MNQVVIKMKDRFQMQLVRARAALLLTLLASLMAGCGTSKEQRESDAFFTSGSREADQRAMQRMAREKQLKESGKGGGEDLEGGGAIQSDEQLTLYDRLGGEQGLAAIVDDFLPRVMQDPRVNWSRKGVKKGGFLRLTEAPEWQATQESVATLRKHMMQFLALATGGPPQYDGRDIKSVHQGMAVTNAEFDAAIGDLKASLDRLKLRDQEQKELLAIMESTRPQIVTER